MVDEVTPLASVSDGQLRDSSVSLPDVAEGFADLDAESPAPVHVAFMRDELEVGGRSAPACDRLLIHDSLRWTCACGASGRVGRTSDGIPYLDAELVRHTPGETKEGA